MPFVLQILDADASIVAELRRYEKEYVGTAATHEGEDSLQSSPLCSDIDKMSMNYGERDTRGGHVCQNTKNCYGTGIVIVLISYLIVYLSSS